MIYLSDCDTVSCSVAYIISSNTFEFFYPIWIFDVKTKNFELKFLKLIN